jgi:hypothetical protein
VVSQLTNMRDDRLDRSSARAWHEVEVQLNPTSIHHFDLKVNLTLMMCLQA